MRGGVALAGVIFAAVGFIVPLAWLPAITLLIVAAGMSPSGDRADGKRKTGGLLGGIVDEAAMKKTTRHCPHCTERIPKEATRCKYCAGEVSAVEKD
jgi:uncharacterized paraquat-inducible protein A